MSEVGQSLLHTCDEALAALVRLGLDDLSDVLALFFLLSEEVVEHLNIDAILLHIDDSQAVFHVFAGGPMLHQDVTEDIINTEESLLKYVFNLLSFGLDDVASPHADDFPLAEVLEEVLGADLTVVLPVVVPVLEGDELDGLLIHIRREALFGHSVVLVRLEVLRTGRVVLSILDEEFFGVFASVLLSVVD